MLSEKKMVQGLPKIKLPNEVCDMCCTGKQARNSYNAIISFNATRKLEVIHYDVCGPFEVKSVGGNRYFVIFIDEFTRKLWIYLLAKKGEVFGVFKKFRLLVQNESGEVISRLRTDGGGEYTSTEFNDFCSSNGINHEVTTPYTPQHNGISERKNRTLVNMIRSMLKQKQMPHYLWGEAAATAAYLINRSPTKKLQDKTPEEAWCGVKPSVQHLKIFGSLCFKHVPDQLRRKLDDKSQVMIMVGYHSTGAYKLYDPNNKKIVFSKDVKFDETKCWNWKDKTSNEFDSHLHLSDSETDEVETEEQEEIVEDTNEEGARVSNRLTRNTQPPSKLRDYERFPDQAVTNEGDFVQLAMLAEAEPVSFEEALKQNHWKKAMIEELDSIEKNDTWRLVQLPTDKKCIDVKWIFKTKLKPDGQVAKYNG